MTNRIDANTNKKKTRMILPTVSCLYPAQIDCLNHHCCLNTSCSISTGRKFRIIEDIEAGYDSDQSDHLCWEELPLTFPLPAAPVPIHEPEPVPDLLSRAAALKVSQPQSVCLAVGLHYETASTSLMGWKFLSPQLLQISQISKAKRRNIEDARKYRWLTPAHATPIGLLPDGKRLFSELMSKL